MYVSEEIYNYTEDGVTYQARKIGIEIVEFGAEQFGPESASARALWVYEEAKAADQDVTLILLIGDYPCPLCVPTTSLTICPKSLN